MADPAPIHRLLDALSWEPIPEAHPGDDGMPYATHRGVLELRELRLRCYTLNDGRRIFDADDVARLFEEPSQ